MREQVISLCIVTVLFLGILFLIPLKLAERLADALAVQGVIGTDNIFTVQIVPPKDLTIPPTAVRVGKDRLRVSLYRGSVLLGELSLNPRSSGERTFPYLETRGHVKRYAFYAPIQSGMSARVYNAMLTRTYLVFYDAEGNYAGYWLIVWET
ncbi:MAG: hypothetical protein K6U12_08420 [Armatimonadetes bacterium]|nr:hypothetical protein [Armatimonadota bacterium]CUU35581.1 hypothetical protein DCOP10_1152 [Armatimonadetes bacterium DC]